MAWSIFSSLQMHTNVFSRNKQWIYIGHTFYFFQYKAFTMTIIKNFSSLSIRAI